MDEKNQKEGLIEVECPVCKDKTMRHPVILKVCLFGCKKCGFTGEHILMKAARMAKEGIN